MEFRKVLVVASVLGLAAFAQGCGNACDDFADAATAKAEECGVTGASDGSSDGAEAECTDEAATLAECYTPCVDKLVCGDAGAYELESATAYLECITACSA